MFLKKIAWTILKIVKNSFSVFCFIFRNCIGIPNNITPVENFDIKKYAGLWYEVARTNNIFERNLAKVKAQYMLRNDGGITVVNSGYCEKKWKVIKGKGYFVDSPNCAHLKVSFFGPFYSSYIVFYLDPDYQYALVSRRRKSLLWVLARKTKIPFDVEQELILEAKKRGFATDSLVFSHK